MSVRFRITHYERIANTSIEYRVDIEDSLYGGAVQNVEAGGIFFTWEYPKMNERQPYEEPVHKSSFICNLQIKDLESDRFTLLSDILDADDDRFELHFYINGEHKWAGKVLTDLLEYPEAPPPFTSEIRAKDLSVLENKTPDLGLISSRSRLSEIIATCLQQTGFSFPIRSFTNVTNTEVDTSEDFLWTLWHENRAFRTRDRAMTAMEVLENICRAYNLIIKQSDTRWLIEQLPAIAKGDDVQFDYDSDGLNPTSSTPDRVITIDRVDKFLLKTSINKVTGAVKQMESSYNHKTPILNIPTEDVEYEFDPFGNTDEFSLGFENEGIFAFGGVLTAEAELSDDNPAGSIVEAYVRVRGEVEGADDVYMDNSGSFSTTEQEIAITLSGSGTTVTGTFDIEQSTGIGSSVVAIHIDFLFAEMVDDTGAGVDVEETYYYNINTYIFQTAQSFQDPNAAITYRYTRTGSYSVDEEISETVLGGGPTPVSVGNPASAPTGTSAVLDGNSFMIRGESGGAFGDLVFEELKLRERISMRRRALRNIRAQLWMEYSPENLIEYNDQLWFFLGGRFQGKKSRWDANILRLRYSRDDENDEFESFATSGGSSSSTGSSGGASSPGGTVPNHGDLPGLNDPQDHPWALQTDFSNVDDWTAPDDRFLNTADDLSDLSSITTAQDNLGLTDGSADLSFFTLSVTDAFSANSVRTDTGRFLSPVDYKFRNAGDSDFRDVEMARLTASGLTVGGVDIFPTPEQALGTGDDVNFSHVNLGWGGFTINDRFGGVWDFKTHFNNGTFDIELNSSDDNYSQDLRIYGQGSVTIGNVRVLDANLIVQRQSLAVGTGTPDGYRANINGTVNIQDSLTGVDADFSSTLDVGGVATFEGDIYANSDVILANPGDETDNPVRADRELAINDDSDSVLTWDNTTQNLTADRSWTPTLADHGDGQRGVIAPSAQSIYGNKTFENDVILINEGDETDNPVRADRTLQMQSIAPLVFQDQSERDLTQDLSWNITLLRNEPLYVNDESLDIRNADPTQRGVVTTVAQEFAGTKTFQDNTIFEDQISTPAFFPGFTGTGWSVREVNSEWEATFDRAVIRGPLTVYELVVNRVTYQDGSEIMGPGGGKVESVVDDTSGSEVLTIEDPNETDATSFAEDDIVMSQEVDVNRTDVVKRMVRRVDSITDNEVTLTTLGDGPSDTGSFADGDDLVAIGNTTDTNRQSIIYTSVIDSGAPFERVLTGIDSWTAWVNAIPVVETGNLNGRVFDGNQLSGYGMFTQRFYATDDFNVILGTSDIMKFGKDVGGGGLHGMFINSDNYWYGTSDFSLGGTEGMQYDPDTNIISMGDNVSIQWESVSNVPGGIVFENDSITRLTGLIADNIAPTSGREWAAEAGADITGDHTAADILGQGDLATLNQGALQLSPSDNMLTAPDFEIDNGWFVDSGSGSIITVSDGKFGGRVFEANDDTWIESEKYIPVDPDKTYYGEVWVRQTQDSTDPNRFYAGVVRYTHDKTRDTAGNGRDYFIASNENINGQSDWVKYTGYFTVPNEDVRYVRFLFLCNWTLNDGVTEIAFARFTEVNADNIPETPSRKWAGESGADVTTDNPQSSTWLTDAVDLIREDDNITRMAGRVLSNIQDDANYARVNATSIQNGQILLSEGIGSLDDIEEGTTYGKVRQTAITSGNILLSEVEGNLDDLEDGTNFGRVASTVIDANGIVLLSATSGNLDDIDEGDTYGKVLGTQLSAGEIVLSSASGSVDWDGQVSGTGKPADNADVTSGQFASSLSDIDDATGRGLDGLDNAGNVKRILQGANLTDGSPGSQDLYLTATHMGFWDGSDWNVYIENDGSFFFRDGNNDGIAFDAGVSNFSISAQQFTLEGGSGSPAALVMDSTEPLVSVGASNNRAGFTGAESFGGTSQSIALWVGGLHEDRETAPVYIQRNGAGQLAGGDISWDSNGNAVFEGTVTVTGGNASTQDYADTQASNALADAEAYVDGNIYQYGTNEYSSSDPPSDYSPQSNVTRMSVSSGGGWPSAGIVLTYWVGSDNAKQVLYHRNSNTVEERVSDNGGWTSFRETEDTEGAQDKADSARNAARDTLAEKLGYDDYTDMYDLAADGNTLIQGGLVTLEILDAHGILADVGTFTDSIFIGSSQEHILDGTNNEVSLAGGAFFANDNSVAIETEDLTVDAPQFSIRSGDLARVSVGPGGTSDQAGIITGEASDVAFFAGSTIGGRASAPYNVTNDGTLTAGDGLLVADSSSLTITGSDVTIDVEDFQASANNLNINSTGLSGDGYIISGISGSSNQAGITGAPDAGDVVFFAGSTIGGRDSAPFNVTNEGVLSATDAFIEGEIHADTGSLGDLTIDGELSMDGTTGRISLPEASNGTRGWIDDEGLTLPSVSDQALNFAYAASAGVSDASVYTDEADMFIYGHGDLGNTRSITIEPNPSDFGYGITNLGGMITLYDKQVYDPFGSTTGTIPNIRRSRILLEPSGGPTIHTLETDQPIQDGMVLFVTIARGSSNIFFNHTTGGNISTRNDDPQEVLPGGTIFFIYEDNSNRWSMMQDRN